MGESRYHDIVVFTTDPWFMIRGGETTWKGDLPPLRPVRPQPAGPPPDDRGPRRRRPARRRIRGLQPAPGTGAAHSDRDGAPDGQAADDAPRLPPRHARVRTPSARSPSHRLRPPAAVAIQALR